MSPHRDRLVWRRSVKHLLARSASQRPAAGLTVLIYHRVGGGTPDERDVPAQAFRAQMDLLARHRVVGLDAGLDELAAGDDRPKIALTFDDGFADVHDHASPVLAELGLPFTVYLASGYVGAELHWEGSTARAPGPALSWAQLEELVSSGLCTVGNHTHHHPRPEELAEDDVAACTEAIESHLGFAPRHFAYPWGVAVTRLEPALRARFRSAVTGEVGRNGSDGDFHRLRRVPVRGSDPLDFVAAKLTGRLVPERAYTLAAAAGKRAGLR